jgi:hypothetical protein
MIMTTELKGQLSDADKQRAKIEFAALEFSSVPQIEVARDGNLHARKIVGERLEEILLENGLQIVPVSTKNMKIEIKTDSDSFECDDCGMDYADGGRVFVDGKEIINKPASAYCMGGKDYSPADLLVMALDKLGHTVLVDGSRYHITCVDKDYHRIKDDENDT